MICNIHLSNILQNILLRVFTKFYNTTFHKVSQDRFVIKEKDCFDELFDLTLVIFVTPF